VIPWSLIWGVGKYVGILAGIAALYFVIDGRGYDRGRSERDAEARQQIAEMEKRVAQRLRQAEGLSDADLDCELRRLRNPKAECGK
jgi:hypothetical protein